MIIYLFIVLLLGLLIIIYFWDKMMENNSVNNFANISHKNCFGANNWEKYLELESKQNPSKLSKNNSTKIVKQPLPISKLKLQNHHTKLENDQSTEFDEKSNQTNSKRRRGLQTHLIEDKHWPNKPADHLNYCDNIADPIVKSKLPNKKILLVKQGSSLKKVALTKQIAIDCEMVGVEIGVNNNMLARVSLVNALEECIYDKYVKPTEPVLDYRTKVSGIRPTDLENAPDFKTVQKEVADILEGRVLVGHALKNDLQVLYLSHPKRDMRDTSKYKPFRADGRTPALKKLAKKYLGVTIQEGEHSSVQDALAAMQLYRMFRKVWEASLWSKKGKDQQRRDLQNKSTSRSVSVMDV